MGMQNRPLVRRFTNHVLDELQARLNGQVIVPEDPQYESARKIWNGLIDRYPALVVRCMSAEDVAHAIRFARDHDLPIALRGGGHSSPGFSTIDDGLVIDLSLMKEIQVNTQRQTARVSPGVKLGELMQAIEPFDLIASTGTALDTGVAGLTLGGGFGYLTGKCGLACDNVVSFTLVTAEGNVVNASAAEHPDLFWGLRGGGGNFGVVTMFEFQLYPAQPVLGGILIHSMSKAREVLQFYRQFFEGAPDELTIYISLITTPEGQPQIIVLPCYLGDLRQGERILEPLRKFGPPAADLIRPMTLLEMVTKHDPGMPPGLNYFDKGCTLPQLTDAAIELTIAAALSKTSALSAVTIQPMNGAAARVPVEATAYPVRSMHYMPVILGAWKDGPAEPHMKWVQNTYNAYKPYSVPETYANLISAEQQYSGSTLYGSNYARLQAIKLRYDPDNLFRMNANIKP
jgi:hypothetical protein